jgi:uncharacterized protein (TIGR00251 family)
MAATSPEPADALVAVRVQPRASADAVGAEREGAISIRLRAAPVDGQANAALLAFLARRLRVPQRQVLLVRGAAARLKWIRVEGLSAEAVRRALLT